MSKHASAGPRRRAAYLFSFLFPPFLYLFLRLSQPARADSLYERIVRPFIERGTTRKMLQDGKDCEPISPSVRLRVCSFKAAITIHLNTQCLKHKHFVLNNIQLLTLSLFLYCIFIIRITPVINFN